MYSQENLCQLMIFLPDSRQSTHEGAATSGTSSSINVSEKGKATRDAQPADESVMAKHILVCFLCPIVYL